MRILFLLFLLISAAFSGIAQVLPNYQLAEGQSAILKAHATDALTYIWFFNDEPINGEHSERLVVKQAGLYTVIALNDCCSSKVSDPVEIVINKDGPAVEVDMQISKQVDAHPVLVGDEFEYQLYIINNSPRSATDVKVIDKLPVSLTYERVFSSHEGNVRYLPDEHQVLWELDSLAKGQASELRIRVKAIEGGVIANTASVEAQELDPNLDNNRASVQKQVQLFKIPNVFTPNGDGVNDLFEIEALAEFTTNELMIFNRWGNLVYEVHNYQNDWQGSNLNEGTYYYVLRVQIGPNWTTFKGYITLLRNVK